VDWALETEARPLARAINARLLIEEDMTDCIELFIEMDVLPEASFINRERTR
jgi:hypothetical protein